MRLYEYEAKALLREAGIPAANGLLVRKGADVRASGPLPPAPWVVKSQVLSGGRMKAGAIRFESEPSGLAQSVAELWDVPVNGSLPEAVLIEMKQSVVCEYYAAVTYDPRRKLPVLILSTEGGVEVETTQGRLGRKLLSSLHPHFDFISRDVLIRAGVSGEDLGPLTAILNRMVQLFFTSDALLLEINPLAKLADGTWCALDVHCEIEDEALFRQRGLLERVGIAETHRSVRAASQFELAAQAIDQRDHRGVAGRVVAFDGDLGLLIGGGGASLTAFDAIRRHGGRPANYCEIGGNPSVAKVADLVKLILSQPGVTRLAVIMNVVNNTRVDMVARGMIKGILALGKEPAEVIAVFRVPGAWEAEGAKVLSHYGVTPCGRDITIDEAARRAVQPGRSVNL